MEAWTEISVDDLIEKKNNFYSGKGDKAKALIDHLEALEFYRMKEIEKHKDFLEAMERNRRNIAETQKKLKGLIED